MTPDARAAYISTARGTSISCISLAEDACADGDGGLVRSRVIDLWQNYDPATGPETGKPWGGLTIQLPVSPDGKALLAANTLSQTVTVVDPTTNEVVKDLPCNAGCHGITFGARRGGGFLAYVSNSFSNAVQVIDVDPNGDGSIADARIAGQMTLGPAPTTTSSGGVLDALPLVGRQGVPSR
ncbi:YncE family protein [Pseudonocardia pini]|uniref:YncE family protein n=1 Tax=Pseudonocardia pini TaxID=2758030 RepID=UPI0015F10325|nr:hypothetical protein [Pseudonocardia pini]